MSYQVKRTEISRPVQEFVLKHQRERKHLVLDGTGPRVTMLLPYLNGAGIDMLSRFDRVYAFSGGVYAYLNYLAYVRNAYCHSVGRYIDELDKQLRAAHRQGVFPLLRLCRNYFRKSTLFPDSPYQRVVEFSFNAEFLRSRLVDVAPNFYPYVGIFGRSEPVTIAEENGFRRDTITVAEALSMAVKIPFLYGGGTERDKYYDANYAPGFLSARQKAIHGGVKTLVMTMWDKGQREEAQFVNIVGGRNPRGIIRRDIASIVFNIPNSRFSEDLRLAYSE